MDSDPFSERSAKLLEAFDFAGETAARENEYQEELKRLFGSLLEVMDSFDRLLAEGSSPHQLHSVELIARQLEQVLAQAGVTPVVCLGKEVDPQRHEIVEVEDVIDSNDDVILAVLTRGYEYNGNLLRRPRVVVARNVQGDAE